MNNESANNMPADPAPLTRHVEGLREALFAQLDRLGKDASPEEIARASAVNDTAGSLIQLAKVEVEFIKAVDAKTSKFLSPQSLTPSLVHRLAG